jgi:hypothetical protein
MFLKRFNNDSCAFHPDNGRANAHGRACAQRNELVVQKLLEAVGQVVTL